MAPGDWIQSAIIGHCAVSDAASRLGGSAANAADNIVSGFFGGLPHRRWVGNGWRAEVERTMNPIAGNPVAFHKPVGSLIT